MYLQLPEQQMPGRRRTLRAVQNNALNVAAGKRNVGYEPRREDGIYASTTRRSSSSQHPRGRKTAQQQSGWGDAYNINEDRHPTVATMDNQTLHTHAYNNRFSDDELRLVLSQMRDKVSQRSYRPWHKLHQSAYYRDNAGLYSASDVGRALRHFHIDADRRTLRCLMHEYQYLDEDNNLSFHWRRFAQALFPDAGYELNADGDGGGGKGGRRRRRRGGSRGGGERRQRPYGAYDGDMEHGRPRVTFDATGGRGVAGGGDDADEGGGGGPPSWRYRQSHVATDHVPGLVAGGSGVDHARDPHLSAAIDPPSVHRPLTARHTRFKPHCPPDGVDVVGSVGGGVGRGRGRRARHWTGAPGRRLVTRNPTLNAQARSCVPDNSVRRPAGLPSHRARAMTATTTSLNQFPRHGGDGDGDDRYDHDRAWDDDDDDRGAGDDGGRYQRRRRHSSRGGCTTSRIFNDGIGRLPDGGDDDGGGRRQRRRRRRRRGRHRRDDSDDSDFEGDEDDESDSESSDDSRRRRRRRRRRGRGRRRSSSRRRSDDDDDDDSGIDEYGYARNSALQLSPRSQLARNRQRNRRLDSVSRPLLHKQHKQNAEAAENAAALRTLQLNGGGGGEVSNAEGGETTTATQRAWQGMFVDEYTSVNRHPHPLNYTVPNTHPSNRPGAAPKIATATGNRSDAAAADNNGNMNYFNPYVTQQHQPGAHRYAYVNNPNFDAASGLPLPFAGQAGGGGGVATMPYMPKSVTGVVPYVNGVPGPLTMHPATQQHYVGGGGGGGIAHSGNAYPVPYPIPIPVGGGDGGGSGSGSGSGGKNKPPPVQHVFHHSIPKQHDERTIASAMGRDTSSMSGGGGGGGGPGGGGTSRVVAPRNPNDDVQITGGGGGTNIIVMGNTHSKRGGSGGNVIMNGGGGGGGGGSYRGGRHRHGNGDGDEPPHHFQVGGGVPGHHGALNATALSELNALQRRVEAVEASAGGDHGHPTGQLSDDAALTAYADEHYRGGWDGAGWGSQGQWPFATPYGKDELSREDTHFLQQQHDDRRAIDTVVAEQVAAQQAAFKEVAAATAREEEQIRQQVRAQQLVEFRNAEKHKVDMMMAGMQSARQMSEAGGSGGGGGGGGGGSRAARKSAGKLKRTKKKKSPRKN